MGIQYFCLYTVLATIVTLVLNYDLKSVKPKESTISLYQILYNIPFVVVDMSCYALLEPQDLAV